VELTTLSLAIVSIWLIGWLMYWLTLRPKTELETLLIKPIWICPNGHEIGSSQPPDKYLCRKCPPREYIHTTFIKESGEITESHNFFTYESIANMSKCPECGDSIEDIKSNIDEATSENNIRLSFSFDDLQKMKKELDNRKKPELTRSSSNEINSLINDLLSASAYMDSPKNLDFTEKSIKNLLNRTKKNTSKLQYLNLTLILLTIIILIILIPIFIRLDNKSNYWLQFSLGMKIIRELLPLFVGVFLGIFIIILGILYRVELHSKRFIKWFIDNLGAFTITIGFFITSLIIIISRKQTYKAFDFFESIIVIGFNIISMSLSAIIFSWIRCRKIKQNLQPNFVYKTYQTINNLYGSKIDKFTTIGNVEGNVNNG
jgi:hypothetical protein